MEHWSILTRHRDFLFYLGIVAITSSSLARDHDFPFYLGRVFFVLRVFSRPDWPTGQRRRRRRRSHFAISFVLTPVMKRRASSQAQPYIQENMTAGCRPNFWRELRNSKRRETRTSRRTRPNWQRASWRRASWLIRAFESISTALRRARARFYEQHCSNN